MKNLYLLSIFNLLAGNLFAQVTTILIKPDALIGKDAMIYSCAPCGYTNLNFGNTTELSAIAWTNGGNSSNSRALIEFDLSIIPTGASIISAGLSLYYNPSSNEGTHSGTNNALLQRITFPWDENTVTWNNQPLTTTQNQITLQTSTSNTQNYLNIDVKALITDMITNPSQSHGFMLKLTSESAYKKLIFASTDHTNQFIHPSLEITYVENCNNLILQPNGITGKDAMIYSCAPCGYTNLNFANIEDLSAIAWTNGGNPSNSRAIIDFDLTSLPAGAIVAEAKLSLFYNPTSVEGNHYGNNSSLLQRIITDWSENSITWDNQPATSVQNEVSIPATLSSTQNLLDVNVTQLVQDMINNPSQSFGFMLKLASETYYKKLIFASSDHADPAKHPKLEICYTLASSIDNGLSSENISIFPNPATDQISLFIPGNTEKEINIYNLNGQLIESHNTTLENSYFKTSDLTAGMYFIQIKVTDQVINKKFIKQ